MYNKKVSTVYNQENSKILRHTTKTFESEVKPSQFKKLHVHSLLEVGCGDGHELLEWKKVFPKANLHAIDSSAEMIKRAKASFSDQAMFYCANMDHIPLKGNTIDFVYSRYTIHYSKNLDKTFREIKRVMRTRGIFIFKVSHPVMETFFKKNKNYLEKGVIAYPILNNSIVIRRLHHTITDYFSGLIKNGFDLIDVKEYTGHMSERIKKKCQITFPSKLIFIVSKR